MRTISIAMQKENFVLTDLQTILGAPYCVGEDYVIYCSDCLDLLEAVREEVFALTVTSPPYNIGKEYEDPLPLEDYLSWCQRWMAQIYRITLPAGAFWLNVGYIPIPGKARALPLPYLLWNRSPFHLIQEVVWNYGAGVASRKSLSPRNEKLLWYVKDPANYTFNLDAIRDPDVKYPHQKKNGRLRCNTIGKNPSDVWQIAKVTSGQDRASPERTPHPAQFPLDLVDRIILGFSNPGDLVLDPFIGSGTVALSCLAHDRKVIGIEINPDYCRIAEQRIKRFLADRQSRLFDQILLVF
ncbi:MAG: site-specific DNA-methyltransferase [Pirellulales bacterium]|nr:site-specific DNA-methyltransferase [Pirellulales bacterium]